MMRRVILRAPQVLIFGAALERENWLVPRHHDVNQDSPHATTGQKKRVFPQPGQNLPNGPPSEYKHAIIP